ncbi:integrase [Sphingomonas jejuensis]|uniref:Integrase n=1 Tax=Sphingomonas jejuensis TaxID=904715 RepID=A0ABX0XM67_9SPHN|nr:integrase arm-type DNA-binding domain-containing protein [Sphingomonas jejuensis]NJC33841.1 integrase [Sphingomonas jejuensis]
MLTEASIRGARRRASAYKLTDGQGLHVHVAATTGTRSFRLRFRWAGKEQLLTLGTWPELSLVDAREQADTARAELAAGRDPRARAYRARSAETFEAVARRWMAQQRRRWTEVHAVDVESSLVRDVFPAIGASPIAAIDAPVVLQLLRDVERRGSIETARRLRQRISAVFALAMAEDLVAGDPAAIVRKALLPPAGKRHQPALLELDDVRALLAAAELVDAGAAVKLASRFLALTAVRLAAVRGARWEEIEDLDGPEPIWRVPAARMKLAVAKKGDARHDHVVPLSAAAVAVLRAARANLHCADANMHGLIFVGRCGAAPIGEAAIGALYARTRFAGRHVPHGWRASFSTILNEALPGERDAIDRALAHSPKDKVEAAYNRAQQLDRRRRLFDAWGEMLSGTADPDGTRP